MLKRRTLKTALAAVISLAVMAAPAYANPGNGNGNGGGNHGGIGMTLLEKRRLPMPFWTELYIRLYV